MQTFDELDKEKRQRILDAIFKEFASGYAKASTNTIAREAGVSKGVLFYYFGSKRGMFEYAVNYTLWTLPAAFFEGAGEYPKDFVGRVTAISRIKLEQMREYPNLYGFVSYIFINSKDAGLSEEQNRRMQQIAMQQMQLIYGEVNSECFREDIPSQLIMKLIQYMMTGYREAATEQIRHEGMGNADVLWKEFHEVIDALKKLFYKQD